MRKKFILAKHDHENNLRYWCEKPTRFWETEITQNVWWCGSLQKARKKAARLGRAQVLRLR